MPTFTYFKAFLIKKILVPCSTWKKPYKTRESTYTANYLLFPQNSHPDARNKGNEVLRCSRSP